MVTEMCGEVGGRPANDTPTRVFCKKRLDLLENMGDNFFEKCKRIRNNVKRKRIGQKRGWKA
jgi:hypothetical protein